MKKYIGTKTVEAEPITLGEFKTRTGRDPYAKCENTLPDDTEGYLVRYADGYESWSPKKVFDEAYKLAETPLDRMRIEFAELKEKSGKLDNFIHNSEIFKTLDSVTKALLQAQLQTMDAYIHELHCRASRMAEQNIPFHGFGFDVAIMLLREGFALSRMAWLGNNFVIKQVPSFIKGAMIFEMKSLPLEAKNIIIRKGNKAITYTDQMFIYNMRSTRADSWSPSCEDIFATDWELYTA